LGAGAVDAGLNGYVAKHYSGRQMNWLHACWGIGATAGPFIIGWALAQGHGWRGGYLAISSVQFSLALLFLFTLGLWNRVPERHPDGRAESALKVPTLPARSPAGWLSPVIFAFYVSVEFTIGLWSGTVLVAHRGISADTAALCTAGFYGALTAGRIGAGFVVERWGNRRVVSGGAVLAAGGMVAFAASAHPVLAATSLAIAGLGLAPIYPGLMHEVPRRFAPESVQTIIGWQSGGASFGAAVLPAVAGWVANHSLIAVPWVVVAVLLVLIVAIRRLDRTT
jgi:fucose permease